MIHLPHLVCQGVPRELSVVALKMVSKRIETRNFIDGAMAKANNEN